MVANTEARDIRLERDALAMAMRDLEYATKALPVLEQRDFVDENARWLWPRLVAALRATGELPAVDDWLDWAALDFGERNPQRHEGVVAYLQGLSGRVVERPALALSHLADVAISSATRRAAEGMIDAVEHGDRGKARQAAADLMRADQAVEGLEEPVQWSKSYRARLARYQHGDSSPTIETPFATLNALMGGGLRCGVFGLIAASTNVGKSTMAVGLGYHAAAVARAVVVHVGVEEMQEETEARYDASLTGIDRGLLLTGQLSDDDRERMAAAFEARGSAFSRLFLRTVPPRTSVVAVEAIVRQIRQEHPGVPMLAVIDSPDDLWSGYADAKRARHEQQTEVYMSVYGMAVSRQLAPIAVWATSHVGREWEGKRLRTKAVADTYTKAKKAGVVLGLTEALAGADMGPDGGAHEAHMLLEVLKTRQGASRRREIHVLCDTGTCRWREQLGGADVTDLDDDGDMADLLEIPDVIGPGPVRVERRHLAVVPDSDGDSDGDGGSDA